MSSISNNNSNNNNNNCNNNRNPNKNNKHKFQIFIRKAYLKDNDDLKKLYNEDNNTQKISY